MPVRVFVVRACVYYRNWYAADRFSPCSHQPPDQYTCIRGAVTDIGRVSCSLVCVLCYTSVYPVWERFIGQQSWLRCSSIGKCLRSCAHSGTSETFVLARRVPISCRDVLIGCIRTWRVHLQHLLAYER